MSAATLSGPNASRSMTPAMRASRVLGWVSFAIGAAELLAPRRTARAVGMDDKHVGLLRTYGAREMLAGVGAHSVYPVPALWSRVGGDVLDIGTLAVAARRNADGSRDRRVWFAIGAVAGIALLDALVASKLAAETREGKNLGEAKDYSDRSGFPDGVAAARGGGIARDAFEGKAGGAAAGDRSPAGQSVSGRNSTDLAGASAETQQAAGPTGDTDRAPASVGGFIGSGQAMPEEAKQALPRPVAYSPA